MEKTSARILRGSDVKLEGTFQLDAGHSVSVVTKKNAASVPVQARIIDSQPQFAVIELTCDCGMKTHIKCEYSNDSVAKQD